MGTEEEDFFRVENLPLLGSGKLDLGAIKKMGQKIAQER